MGCMKEQIDGLKQETLILKEMNDQNKNQQMVFSETMSEFL